MNLLSLSLDEDNNFIYLIFTCPCIVGLLQITANKIQRLLIYLFLQALYIFQAVHPPIIKST